MNKASPCAAMMPRPWNKNGCSCGFGVKAGRRKKNTLENYKFKWIAVVWSSACVLELFYSKVVVQCNCGIELGGYALNEILNRKSLKAKGSTLRKAALTGCYGLKAGNLTNNFALQHNGKAYFSPIFASYPQF
ncbi:hypothetical protein [Allorhizobium undicola]|uniref:hypothetical protein n=1 Tax=Allorhizobium undicola TaxID=78527 RepID=UPI0012B5B859|nr:hypothetical protein [Allorhizobium undicola]